MTARRVQAPPGYGLLSLMLLLSVSAASAPRYPAVDFHAGPMPWRCDESGDPAKATGRVVPEGSFPGQPAFQLDFELPANRNAVFAGPVEIDPSTLPPDPWGLELWLRLEAPGALELWLMATDDGGELWECRLPLPEDAEDGSWQHLTIPFDWFHLITWERVDGVLSAPKLETITLRLHNGDVTKPQSGSLGIGGIGFVDAGKRVAATEQDDFVLLDLREAYDSDGVAYERNPMDGDFHTGEWQHRALPGEVFPQEPVATLLDVPFRMPDVSDGADNHIRCNGQKLVGFPASGYSALYVLATGKFGHQRGDVTLFYEDGTHSTVLLEVSDWSDGPYFGDAIAIRFPYTYYETTKESRRPRLYLQSIGIDPRRRLSAIRLPWNDYLKVFAATLSSAAEPVGAGALQTRSLAEVHPRYAMKSLEELTFDGVAQGAGVFGGYLHREKHNYRLEAPTYNGYATFASDVHTLARRTPTHDLIWDGFSEDGAAYVLGGIQAPGRSHGVVNTELLDWTCVQYTCTVTEGEDQGRFSAIQSRTSPAVLYESEQRSIRWRDPLANGQGYVSLAQASGCEHTSLEVDRTIACPTEPWLLIWHTGGGARDFDVPILLVLERKPATIVVVKGQEETLDLQFEFPDRVGKIAAMPLFGIRQVRYSQTRMWVDELPETVVEQCRAWAARLQAYPVGVSETADISESERTVTVRDEFRYLEMHSEWGVEPRHVAMAPPVALLALDNGYDVSLSTPYFRDACDTFWGPMGLAEGSTFVYEIPLPRGIDHMPTLVKTTGDAAVARIQSELRELLDAEVPEDSAESRMISDTCSDLSLLRVLAPSRILFGDNEQHQRYCRAVVENALLPRNLKVEKEPLTGQFYLMDDRFWAKDAHYDKEWAIGTMLQGFWNYAYYCDDAPFLQAHWDRIRGLYRYYQLVFDWATGSTYTFTTGMGANSDGVRIAWEGMQAMARMARSVGDERIHKDACLRSARQGMSLYASWFAPQWAADHNYVMRKGVRVPPEAAELRFAPDGTWAEEYTCNTAHTEDFFQVTHAFYLFNLAHLTFLHDTGLDEQRLRPWIYEAVPELHPVWFDGNVMCEGAGRYYGSDHAMAHLVVRALLFHEDPSQLWDYYQRSADGTLVMHEWYRPQGSAPYAMAAMVTGAAPVVLAPVDSAQVLEHTYDATTRIQHIRFLGTREAQRDCIVRCWRHAVRAVVVNGREQQPRYDEKTDYLRIALELTPGKAAKIQIRYGR